jgi:type IV pilus assembly protein PilX
VEAGMKPVAMRTGGGFARPMRYARRGLRRAQRGVILFISLIVLVAMTLAGIALMRSVDTNLLIAGNLAFRQGTTSLADLGVESARTWLASNTGLLTDNQPGGFTAYWANWQAGLDFIGSTATTGDDYNWGNSQTVTSPDPSYTINWVIHRLCGSTGAPTDASANCMSASISGASTTNSGGTKGAVSYGTQALPSTSAVYYRVTVRVIGPRNTTSFVQAVLN